MPARTYEYTAPPDRRPVAPQIETVVVVANRRAAAGRGRRFRSAAAAQKHVRVRRPARGRFFRPVSPRRVGPARGRFPEPRKARPEPEARRWAATAPSRRQTSSTYRRQLGAPRQWNPWELERPGTRARSGDDGPCAETRSAVPAHVPPAEFADSDGEWPDRLRRPSYANSFRGARGKPGDRIRGARAAGPLAANRPRPPSPLPLAASRRTRAHRPASRRGRRRVTRRFCRAVCPVSSVKSKERVPASAIGRQRLFAVHQSGAARAA